ncbi:MAG: adenine deaminase [Proteobacteria bacterium]|nr:adenine deaminase [Pseudomonadota bacterium]
MRELARPRAKDLKQRIDASMGRKRADLLLRGGRIVDVFSGLLREADVAISHDRIVGFGNYTAEREIDVSGHIVAPGFMDGHLHIESSMVTPAQYARSAVPRGTTALVIDPHEIANVMGPKGIYWMIRCAAKNPLHVFVMVPSCVPATSMETSGGSVSERDLEALMREPWVLGIGEMMNFPGVIAGKTQILKKLMVAHGKRIDGHAPGISGRNLYAYIAAGIASDHECTTLEEAQEKLANGMFIMIREGSSAKNLADLAPLVTPENSRRLMLVSDDRHPYDLVRKGHMDSILTDAVQCGIDPITAIRMVTLNTAEYFGLKDMGGIAPGYRADLVVLKDLEDFRVEWVFHGGKGIVEHGVVQESAFQTKSPPMARSFRVPKVQARDLRFLASSERARIIEVVPGQIVTRGLVESIPVVNGLAVPDPDRDILKIAVVERHHGSGRIGKGFIKGFGLKEGAIGSSVAHDSHNIIVVGTNEVDMASAVNEIARMGGGLVAVSYGRIRSALPLPLAGLLSDRPVEEVEAKLNALQLETRRMGSSLESPFMALSFMALPVIPKLKITDKGIVDVDAFQIVDLFV